MLSNDNIEWVSSTCKKKKSDNHELEDECVSNDHHGVTDFVMIGYFRSHYNFKFEKSSIGRWLKSQKSD